jgi:hypothetical protein
MANTTNAASGRFQSAADDFVHYLAPGGAVQYYVDSSGVIHPAGLQTVAVGQPQIVAIVNNAAIGYAVFNSAAAVNLLPTTAPTGTYRISLYMVPTTTFATSTEEVITFGWTDDDKAQTVAYTSSAQTAGTITIGSQLVRFVTGTALTYTPSVTGSSATAGVMAVSIVVERLI